LREKVKVWPDRLVSVLIFMVLFFKTTCYTVVAGC